MGRCLKNVEKLVLGLHSGVTFYGFGLTFRGYIYGLSFRFRFGSKFNFGFRFCVYRLI